MFCWLLDSVLLEVERPLSWRNNGLSMGLGLFCSPETLYVTVCHSENKVIFHSLFSRVLTLCLYSHYVKVLRDLGNLRA